MIDKQSVRSYADMALKNENRKFFHTLIDQKEDFKVLLNIPKQRIGKEFPGLERVGNVLSFSREGFLESDIYELSQILVKLQKKSQVEHILSRVLYYGTVPTILFLITRVWFLSISALVILFLIEKWAVAVTYKGLLTEKSWSKFSESERDQIRLAISLAAIYVVAEECYE